MTEKKKKIPFKERAKKWFDNHYQFCIIVTWFLQLLMILALFIAIGATIV